MPFLPLYFQQLGITDTGSLAIWTGLSLGITPAITASVAPLWARIAERYGRKLMVARSLASFVIVMSLLAAVRAPWQVVALRALLGFFAGYGTLAMTMAAESSPVEHTATAIGWVQTAQRLGPAVGPIVGGALAQAVGLRESFLIAAGVYLLALLLVLFGYHEPRVARHAAAAVEPISFGALRKFPHFLLFMGAVFSLQLVDRSFGPILPLYLGDVGVTAARTPFLSGALFTAAAGAAALGNQVTGWFLRRFPVGRLVPVAVVVSAIPAACLGAAPPFGVMMVCAAVFGFALGLATTAVYTAASLAVGPSARGVAFGYLTTAYLAALAVSPVVAGFIGSASTRAVFFVDAAGLTAIAWIVAAKMQPSHAHPAH